MKRLAQAFFLGCIFATAAAQEAPPDCTKWSIFGYRIGMSEKDAVALRGGKLKLKKNQLRPEIAQSEKTRVQFAGDHWVCQVYVRPWDNAGAVKLSLIRQLGPPFADNLQGDPINLLFANAQIVQTRWESEACNSDIILNVTTATNGQMAMSGAHLFLVQHGAAITKP